MPFLHNCQIRIFVKGLAHDFGLKWESFYRLVLDKIGDLERKDCLSFEIIFSHNRIFFKVKFWIKQAKQ